MVANPGPPPDDTNIVTWRGPFNGNFSDASKWLQNRVPGSTDTALFDAPGSYAVNVGGENTKRLLLETGHVTFTNADYTLNTLSPDEPSITLTGGTLTLASGALHARHVSIAADVGGGPGATIALENAGTSLDASGELRIGLIAPGRFMAENGASAVVGTTRLGSANAGSTELVKGEGATLNSGNIIVQGNSTQLSVLDGGHLTSGVVQITSATEPQLFVRKAGSFNSVQSRWDMDEFNNDDGNLNILDGGHVR